MKKQVLFLLTLILCSTLTACQQITDNTKAHPLDTTKTTYFMKVKSWEKEDDKYILHGDNIYDGYILLTNEEKKWLEKGGAIFGKYEKKECFTLRKSTENESDDIYELEQNGTVNMVRIQDYSFMEKTSDTYWTVTETVSGLPERITLEYDIKLKIPANTEIVVTNFFTGGAEYPSEKLRTWTMDKFYEMCVIEEDHCGLLYVTKEDGAMKLIDWLIPWQRLMT